MYTALAALLMLMAGPAHAQSISEWPCDAPAQVGATLDLGDGGTVWVCNPDYDASDLSGEYVQVAIPVSDTWLELGGGSTSGSYSEKDGLEIEAILVLSHPVGFTSDDVSLVLTGGAAQAAVAQNNLESATGDLEFEASFSVGSARVTVQGSADVEYVNGVFSGEGEAFRPDTGETVAVHIAIDEDGQPEIVVEPVRDGGRCGFARSASKRVIVE